MNVRQQPLFIEVPPSLRVTRVLLEYADASPTPVPEAATENWYAAATATIKRLLANAPADMQAMPREHLAWVRDLFRDLAESQSADFLADDERVDISDVIPIDDTPYDEERETEERDEHEHDTQS